MFTSNMVPLRAISRKRSPCRGSYTFQIGVLRPDSKKATVIERKITLPPLPADGKPS
jgi:hypothetical protein